MKKSLFGNSDTNVLLTPAKYKYTNTDLQESDPFMSELPEPGDLTVNYNTVVQGTAQAQVDGLAGVYLGTPVGTVVMWSGYKDKDGVDTNLNPGGLHEMADGWLLCNGTTIALNSEENLKKYKALYRVIIGQDPSPSFGPGPNPLTFPPLLTLPNFCQRFPLGALGQSTLSGFDTTLRRFGGESTHTLSQDEMPAHTHEIIQDGKHRHTVESYQIRYSETTGHPSLNDSNNGNYRINRDYSRFFTTEDGLHSHTINNTGGGQPHNNIPPFYAINFIIKYK